MLLEVPVVMHLRSHPASEPLIILRTMFPEGFPVAVMTELDLYQ